MACGDRGLKCVWPLTPTEPLGTLERSEPATDQQLIPSRAVLIEQQYRLALGPTRARSRDAWISINATRP